MASGIGAFLGFALACISALLLLQVTNPEIVRYLIASSVLGILMFAQCLWNLVEGR